jgi:hypothetical protein
MKAGSELVIETNGRFLSHGMPTALNLRPEDGAKLTLHPGAILNTLWAKPGTAGTPALAPPASAPKTYIWDAATGWTEQSP